MCLQRTSVVERSEEAQAVGSLEERPLDLHLSAGQRAAGGEALRAGHQLLSGLHLIRDHLQALLLRSGGRTHPVGLSGHRAGSDVRAWDGVYIKITMMIQ